MYEPFANSSVSPTDWSSIIQNVTLVIAVLVAGLAVYVSFKQGRDQRMHNALQREHNRLSVKPGLTTAREIEKRRLTIALRSTGLGPAIINNLFMDYNGERFNASNSEEMHRLSDQLTYDFGIACQAIVIVCPFTIPAGESQIVLRSGELEFESQEEGREHLDRLTKIALTMEIESMYGEKKSGIG